MERILKFQYLSVIIIIDVRKIAHNQSIVTHIRLLQPIQPLAVNDSCLQSLHASSESRGYTVHFKIVVIGRCPYDHTEFNRPNAYRILKG